MKKLVPIRIAERAFEIDLRGWICPLPKYVLESLLPKLDPGSQLDLLVDCPGAITDIPNDAAEAGLESEVTQIGNGEWRISVSG
jgi:tRNA 2-thiouridine synthesizing protein A